MFSKRKRTLSENGVKLFSLIDDIPLIKITKKNSWSTIKSPRKSPQKSQLDNNIKYKGGCNLKRIFMNLITTDFDEKIEENSNNMMKASKKLLIYLNTEKSTKIPVYVNNAVINLVLEILSNGEKYLTIRQVKFNIHFYLKLADKAMTNNDHQTAILIKCVIDNYNIIRLKIKYNKGEVKIINKLACKYGKFQNCFSVHIEEFLSKFKNQDLNLKIDEYIPSAMVLHMCTKKIETYIKEFNRIGKHIPVLETKRKELIQLSNAYVSKLECINKLKITGIYTNLPANLDIINKISNGQNIDITKILYHLSCNVKNTKVNNKIGKADKKKSNVLVYQN